MHRACYIDMKVSIMETYDTIYASVYHLVHG